MASARALANQKLYHAAVLLQSWREAEGGLVPASILDAAFGQSVQRHLHLAYGWFLLELAGYSDLPTQPPLNCKTMLESDPELAAQRRGELHEFLQLEREGWLQGLVAPTPERLPRPPARGASQALIRTETPSEINLEACQQWHRRLESVMDRMADSLDEC